MKHPIALCLLFALSLFAGCSGSAVEFAGTFEGQGLELVLQEQGEGYAGSIELDGNRYQATARRSGSGLHGSFVVKGEDYAFDVVPSGAGLRLSSGGANYQLQRRKAANPLAGGGTPDGQNPLGAGGDDAQQVDADVARELEKQQEQAAAALKDAVSFSRTYKHPGGAFFMYPDGWKVRDAGDGSVAIEPPELATIDGEQAEVLVLAAEPSEVERVDDPEVRTFAKQFVESSMPFLKSVGDGEIVQVGSHKVFRMQWRGNYQSHAMAAAFQVLLLDDVMFGAFAFTMADRYESRLRTMNEVLRTVGYEQPKADPRLVGSWRYEKSYISGTFSSITVRNLWLRADGVCFEGGRMMAGMSHSDSEGNMTGSSHGDAQGADSKGRWHTEGTDIVMDWDGGETERWGFYIEGRNMLWTSGDVRKLWKRSN